MSSLIGNKFGKWLVIKESEYAKDRVFCKCECGKEKHVLKNNLMRGKSTSCGCYRNSFLSDTRTNGGRDNKKLYGIWSAIKRRCYNKNSKDYKNYGGRGITMCDEWLHDFPSFLRWSLENGYKENLTIDRIDNDKAYSPDNCRWITRKMQNNNKRDTIFITINGTTKPLTEWSDIYNISQKTIRSRIHYGWSEEDLLLPTKGRGANGSTAR